MYAVPYLTVPAAGAVLPGGPAGLAMTLAAHPERWRSLVDYRADTRWYRLLERTARHEVWLLSWLPGQGTDLHDHGPACGAFAVAAGTLTERVVAGMLTERVVAGMLTERVVAGKVDRAVEVTRTLDAGRSRAFGPHYVHQLTNTGTVPAVSVHVCTPGLSVMIDGIGGFRAWAAADLPTAAAARPGPRTQ